MKKGGRPLRLTKWLLTCEGHILAWSQLELCAANHGEES